MREIFCTDETFDPNLTSEYKLSIQAGLDGFSFSILDDIRKNFIVFRHYPFSFSNYSFLERKIEEILRSEEILQNRFKSAVVRFATQHITVVPDFFNEHPGDREIFEFSSPLLAEETISSFAATGFGCRILFSYPARLFHLFETYFPGIGVSCYLKPVFAQAALQLKNNPSQAWVNFAGSFFSLLVFNGRKIIFSNSFGYKNDTDVIYFLLQSLQTSGMAYSEIPVFINGQISDEGRLAKLISEKFKNVSFLKLPAEFQYSYTFSEFPAHRFFTVIGAEE